MINILLLLATTLCSASEIVLTENNLTSVYFERSKQSEPERLIMKARKKEEGHFFRSFLPSLEASYGREAFQEENFPSASSYGWNVEGRISLFNGGRDWFEERVREYSTAKATAEKLMKDQSVLLSLRKSFWSFVYYQSLIATIEKALKDNTTIAQSADRRIRAGMASPVDRLEFRINGIRLRQDLQKAKNDLRNTENQIRALLMIPLGESVVVSQKMTDDHDVLTKLDVKKDDRLPKNPTFAAIQAQAKVNEYLSKKNSRWFMPSLNLYGGYERPTLREDSTGGFGLSQWYVGAAIRLNLGEVATSIVTQQARSLEADSQLQLKENTLLLNHAQVTALAENIKALHELFHDAETSIQEAEGYVLNILREYDKGVKNSIDALNATRQSYDARREGLGIMRDYKYAIVDFYNLTGEGLVSE